MAVKIEKKIVDINNIPENTSLLEDMLNGHIVDEEAANNDNTINEDVTTVIESKNTTVEYNNLKNLENEVTDITYSLDVINDLLSAVNNDIISIRTDISKIEKDMSNLTVEVNENKENISNNDNDIEISNINNSIDKINKEIKTLSTTDNDIILSINKLSEKDNNIQEKVISLETNINDINNKVIILENNILDINNKLSNLPTSNNSSINSAELNAIKGKIVSLEDDITDINNSLLNLETNLNEKELGINDLKVNLENSLLTNVNSLNSKVDNINISLHNSIDNLDTYIKNIESNYNENFNVLKKNVDDSVSYINTLNTIVSNNTNSLNDLEGDLDTIKKNITELDNQINEVKDNTINILSEELNNKLEIVKKDIGSIERNIDNNINIINNEISEIILNTENNEKNINTIDDNINNINDDIQIIKDNINILDTDVKNIETNLSDIEKSIDVISNNISDNTVSIDSLKGDVASIKNELLLGDKNEKITKEDIENITKNIVELDDNVTVINNNINVINNNINDLDNKIININTAIENNEKFLSDINVDNSNLKKDISLISKNTNDISSDIETLEKNINELSTYTKGTINDIYSDIDNITHNIDDLNKNINTIDETLGVHENLLGDVNRDVDSIKKQISSIDENGNSIASEINTIKTEISDLSLYTANTINDVYGDIDDITHNIGDLEQSITSVNSRVDENTEKINIIVDNMGEIPAHIELLVKEEITKESGKIENDLNNKVESEINKTENVILEALNESEIRLDEKIEEVQTNLDNLDIEPEIYYSNTDPFEDENIEFPQDKLWITTQGAAAGIGENDPIIKNIWDSINTIQNQLAQCMRLVNQGIIAGDSSVGGRTTMMKNSSTTAIHPITGQSEPTDYIEPDGVTYTVPNLVIKKDTLSNFKQNYFNLLDGELIWIESDNTEEKDPGLYIFLNNKGFVQVVNGTGGNIDTETMTDEQLKDAIKRIENELYLSQVGLEDGYGNKYAMRINENGNIIVYNDRNNYLGTGLGSSDPKGSGRTEVGGSYISNYLRINSVFFGGENTTIDSNSAATHNFVELSNASVDDINLNGIYLMYLPYSGYSNGWYYLPLKGTIYAGNTFTIRGAQCSIPSNTCVNVDSYDMEWYVKYKDNNDNIKEKLIEFSSEGGTFYLVTSSEENKVYDISNGTGNYVSIDTLSTTHNPCTNQTDRIPNGYIDLMGVKSSTSDKTIFGEGNPLVLNGTDEMKNCIFFRQYGLDPGSTTVLKTYDKRKTESFWTYANLMKEGTDKYPYFTKAIKEKLAPGSSSNKKNFYDKRSTFIKDAPNCVNITFGKQATDTGNKDAERCFNWISVGYYNEFIEYKLADSNTWIRKYSISKNNYTTEYANDDVVREFIDVYDRYRWVTSNLTPVTTHKVIIRGLESGNYVYRVGRDGDNSYYSEEYTFKVRSNDEVNKGFKFIQTTDQQGFNFNEYQAWTKSAYVISQNEGEFDFLINTGDMTQSGNRESEWIDYYMGKRYFSNKEEMPCIGNNDLCGTKLYEMGDGTAGTYKVSSRSIWLFYTFDLDKNNSVYFKYKPNGDTTLEKSLVGPEVLKFNEKENYIEYFVPSLYSYNYGNYHFIVLNSEFMTNKSQNIFYNGLDENTFRANVYYNQYKWLEKDYELYGANKKLITYCHEIPFCIVKIEESDVYDESGTIKIRSKGDAEPRTVTNGSKLNIDLSAGKTTSMRDEDTNDYTGGFSFSEFFQNHNIKLCLGGHKHSYSLSYPTAEKITTGSDNKRKVESNDPWVDNGSSNDYNGGYTTYLMCQATGFKLESNKDKPGNKITWLQKYFPVAEGTDTLNKGQQFPMYTLIDCNDNRINLYSRYVDGVYDHSEAKVVAFNINKQLDTLDMKNVLTSEDNFTDNKYTILI